MSKEWQLRKNQMDLQFQNGTSVSKVFLGGGLTTLVALWPLLEATSFDFAMKIFLNLMGSGILFLLGVLTRSRAHGYLERIADLG